MSDRPLNSYIFCCLWLVKKSMYSKERKDSGLPPSRRPFLATSLFNMDSLETETLLCRVISHIGIQTHIALSQIGSPGISGMQGVPRWRPY